MRVPTIHSGCLSSTRIPCSFGNSWDNWGAPIITLDATPWSLCAGSTPAWRTSEACLLWTRKRYSTRGLLLSLSRPLSHYYSTFASLDTYIQLPPSSFLLFQYLHSYRSLLSTLLQLDIIFLHSSSIEEGNPFLTYSAQSRHVLLPRTDIGSCITPSLLTIEQQ